MYIMRIYVYIYICICIYINFFLKTHQLPNLWVFHFTERVFFDPGYVHPYRTSSIFFPTYAMFYDTFYFSITQFLHSFHLETSFVLDLYFYN